MKPHAGMDPLALWYNAIGQHLVDPTWQTFAISAACHCCGTTDQVFQPGGKRKPVCVRCHTLAKKHLMASKPGVKASLDQRHGVLISAEHICLLADIAVDLPGVDVIDSKTTRFEAWLEHILREPPAPPFLLVRFAAKPMLVARGLRLSHSLENTYLCSDTVLHLNTVALAKALALLTCDTIPSRSWRQALHDHAIAQHAATPARFGAWQAACQNLLTAQERFTCLRSLAPCDAAAPIPHGSHEYDVLTWLR